MTNANSLLVGGATGWHDGSGALTWSILTSVPSYYPKVDRNHDGVKDSWNIGGEILPFNKFSVLTAAQQKLAEFAVSVWNDVANLNLTKAAAGVVGDITFGNGVFPGLFGFVADFAGTPGVKDDHGDVWLNQQLGLQANAELGSTGYQTYIHEFGHAIGLHHPNEDPNNNAGTPTNNNQYTVMSYVVHPGQASETEANAAWPITPMLYDIQAAQKLYGANLTTRTGDTNYIGGTGAVFRLQDGGELSNGRIGILTIYDAGGIDTIDASAQTGAVKIDLNPGHFSTIGPVANNVAVAYAVKSGGVIINYIENAKGGSAADTLTGNATNNALTGNAGNDTLSGGAGNDTLFGGDGTDRLVGGPGNDTYLRPTGDIIVETSTGGIDTVETNLSFSLASLAFVERVALTGIANVNATGNALSNLLTGNTGNNVLRGGGGGDNLKGNGGNDILFGEEGNDTLNGGAGGDVFKFAPSNSGDDRIVDFNTAQDSFNLGGAHFTDLEQSSGNTKLFYSGGTILVVGVTGLDLSDWNNLAESPHRTVEPIAPGRMDGFLSGGHLGDYIGV